MIEPIKIEIGGLDDEWRDTFPSARTRDAVRHYEKTNEITTFFTIGHVIISFIETHLVFTESKYAGLPFELMDWQKRLLLELYEVEFSKDDGKFLLRYRWALVGVPKKNGKTELFAALGLSHCVTLEEISPKVVCAAASDEQANLLFGAAKRMCEWSSTLDEFSEARAKEIEFSTNPKIPGYLKRLAASAGTNDGGNISCSIIDEFHEWIAPKSRSVFTVITQGGGAREQPINLIITTAGSEEDSVCYELYEHGISIRDGEIEDHTFYFMWWGIEDENVDHKDPEVWKKANPSYGLILKEAFYADMLTKRRESEFRRYFLNQWVEVEDIWEAAGLWDQLAGKPKFSIELPTYVGIDIGRKHDSAAVVWMQLDFEGHLNIAQKIWTNPYGYRDLRYGKWSLPIVEVEEFLIREIWNKYPKESMVDSDDGYMIPGPCFAYDPHFFVRSAERLVGENMNMVEFAQTDTRMVPASQSLFEMIKSQRIIHDGDLTARRHIRSVIAKEKERGWRISKPDGSRKRVDFAIALAMCTFLCVGIASEQSNAFNIW